MPFRKTPEQHRQMAQLLLEAGNETLANQHDLIALAIEHWQRRVDEATQRGVERLHAAPTTVKD
jgi:hypothetical protein